MEVTHCFLWIVTSLLDIGLSHAYFCALPMPEIEHLNLDFIDYYRVDKFRLVPDDVQHMDLSGTYECLPSEKLIKVTSCHVVLTGMCGIFLVDTL